jgi:hypothetical protein
MASTLSLDDILNSVNQQRLERAQPQMTLDEVQRSAVAPSASEEQIEKLAEGVKVPPPPTTALGLLKSAIQPFRTGAAVFARNLGQSLSEGETVEQDNPEIKQRFENLAQSLERPIHGQAQGLPGTLAQLPAGIATMTASPGLTALTQLQQGGHVDAPNVANAALTLGLGNGVGEKVAKLLPFGPRISNAIVNAEATAGVNALSGQKPLDVNTGVNALFGGLTGGHGEGTPAPAEVPDNALTLGDVTHGVEYKTPADFSATEAEKSDAEQMGKRAEATKQDRRIANNPMNTPGNRWEDIMQGREAEYRSPQQEGYVEPRVPLSKSLLRRRGVAQIPGGPNDETNNPLVPGSTPPVENQAATNEAKLGKTSEPVRPLSLDEAKAGQANAPRNEALPEGIEAAAARENPEIVPKLNAGAPKSDILQHFNQGENWRQNMAERTPRATDRPIEKLAGSLENVKNVPENPTHFYQQGENWRQNVAEQDLAKEGPTEKAPHVPSPQEQKAGYEKAFTEDVNTAQRREPSEADINNLTKPYHTLPEPPVDAHFWSPQEIRNWAEQTGHSLENLPEKATRAQMLAKIYGDVGKVSNPAGEGAPNPHPPGSAEAPTVPTNQLPAPVVAKYGSNAATNAELRRTLGRTEFEVHRQAGLLEPHHATAEQALKSPEDRQAWVDAVEKTGQSPVPELQKLADTNRKLNLEEIAKRKAMGENIASADEVKAMSEADREAFLKKGGTVMNPNHIAFLAKPTDRFVGGTRDLQGPEGFRYNRTSENRADFENKIANSNGGLELRTNNISKEIQLGHADVAKSLSFRRAFNDRVTNGGAKYVAAGNAAPDGWREAPDIINNDRLINPDPSEKLVIPEADARALENFQNSGNRSPLGNLANSGASAIHYLLDLVTPMRSAVAELGNVMESSVNTAINTVTGSKFSETGVNPAAHWKQGYDLMTKSIDSLRENPITKPLADGLQYAMEHGGARADLKAPEKPGLLESLKRGERKYNPLSYIKRSGDPLRIATTAHMGAYAMERVQSGDWTPEEGTKFAESQRKIIDTLFGHGKSVNTINPELAAWAKTVAPLHEWASGGFKATGRAVAETVAAKGNVNKTSAPKLLANVAAAVTSSAIVAAALRKYYTGKLTFPTSISDIGNTGRTNPDGSPEQAATASTFLPMYESIAKALKGDYSGAVMEAMGINPFFKSIANGMSGWDYRGNRLSTVMDRVKTVAEGFSPIIGRNPDQTVSVPSLFGVRTIPQSVSSSAFSSAIREQELQNHRALPPDKQAEQDQKSQWLDQLDEAKLDPATFKDKVRDIVTQMAKAGYDADKIKDALKESFSPKGPVRYAAHADPGEMADIIDQASPEERSQVEAVMLDRIRKISDEGRFSKESSDTQLGWLKLLKKFKDAKDLSAPQ